MSVTLTDLAAQVDLTVAVSRQAPGDLEAGVERQLERIDGVDVESIEIRGLEPGLNDLTVEVTAQLRLRPAEERADGEATPESIAARLSEGFGVEAQAVRLDRTIDPP